MRAFLMTLLVGALSWVASDSENSATLVASAAEVASPVVEEVEGYLLAQQVLEGIDKGDGRSLTIAGWYHTNPSAIYPESFLEHLARGLGEPDPFSAREFYRLAEKAGDFVGSIRYWELTGAPEQAELVRRANGGSRAAAWKLMQQAGPEPCAQAPVIEQLLVTAKSDSQIHAFLLDQGGDLETFQRWQSENCSN
ncbi:MAG: hypothetical protein JJ896_08750 [Rhodothermales bacterium]|nr:hypothetical protein [Rhodothermales bacterium]MBO6779726.1 hypothetical protein [Rhodothermales bacterium]